MFQTTTEHVSYSFMFLALLFYFVFFFFKQKSKNGIYSAFRKLNNKTQNKAKQKP